MWTQNSHIKAAGSIVPPCNYVTPKCHVRIDVLLETKERTKLDFGVCWKPIGDDSEKASEKEHIIHYVSKLPSECLLQDINTLDQLRKWVSAKNSAMWKLGRRDGGTF
jgi:hypothetical protein